MEKFHAQIWQVGKSTRTCLEMSLMAKLVLKQSVNSHGPLVFGFFPDLKFSQFFSSVWLCQRETRFLKYYQLNQCQILWKGSYLPYSQIFSFSFWFSNLWFFNDVFSYSLTWDPMGVKMSKCYSSHSCDSFSTKFFLKFAMTDNGSPHKSYFFAF